MKKLSAYLMGIVLAIAALTLAGRWSSIAFLKYPFAQSVAMRPASALSMVMGTISFFLLCKMAPRKRRVMLSRALAAGVLLIGLLKLLPGLGINTDIDHWLFGSQVFLEPEISTGPKLIIAINSAIGFIVTGVALLLMKREGKWPGIIVNYLALWGFVVGMFAFIGFIYNVNEFYGILPYMSVALTTAVCFICFGLAVLFENNESAFMWIISSNFLGGKIARPLTFIGIAIPFIFGYVIVRLSAGYPLSVPLYVAALSTSIVLVFLGVLFYLARALNISDAERREARLQLERQAQLFQIMPDAVIYGNRDFTITHLNPAALRIFDVNETELGKLTLDDLFITGTGAAAKELVNRDLWGEKGFWRGESDLTTRTGKKINALAMLKAVTNAEGEKVGWLGVYTDISLLRLYEELKAANNYLEQMAFISAHDVKSPILTLKGLVDLMYNSANIKEDDVQVLDMQREVIDEMQRTNKALNDILKLRNSLKIKGNGCSETLPFGKIMANVTATLQTEIISSNSKLELEITEVSDMKVPQIYFQSMFYNLLSNSIKYRHHARPLQIKLTGKRAGSNTVKFTIEDNGLGFDLDQNKNKVFGIFKRFHTHVEGTGVGLHIVKSIVEAFDGNIEVESEPGQGTRFNLTFKDPVLS